jgi:hypothetical protein
MAEKLLNFIYASPIVLPLVYALLKEAGFIHNF